MQLEKEIEKLSRKLDTFPVGKLLHRTCGKYIKWYRKENNTITYLDKKQKQLLKELTLKKYLLALSSDYENEKYRLDSYLKHYTKYPPIAPNMLLDTSCYSKQLSSYFKPVSAEIQEWMEAPYEKNPKHLENLKHISIFGHKVRSKSESLIDLCLQNYNIPFRYECALHLDEIGRAHV